jgi:hypothetical protein
MLIDSPGNNNFQTKVEWGVDLASEHERYIYMVFILLMMHDTLSVVIYFISLRIPSSNSGSSAI